MQKQPRDAPDLASCRMRVLCAGVLSQSQVLLAFGVVAELFNGVRDSPAEPMDGALPKSRFKILGFTLSSVVKP